MIFAFIQDQRKHFPLRLLFRVLQVSRSGFYAWKNRGISQRQLRRRKMTRMIQVVHAESDQTYGSPRVHRALISRGIDCCVNFVAKLMRFGGIGAQTRRRYKRTTDSNHQLPVAPNRLSQEFKAQRRDQVWLSDITYIPTREGWLYCCTVEDLYSRRIVGWQLSPRIDSRLVVDAVQMALVRRQAAAGLVLHSDRGSQYCSDHLRSLLRKHQVLQSMSRKGNCYDNAPMESFFRSMKVERVHRRDYQCRSEARKDLIDYIESFYNRRRLHSALNYISPVEFESMA